MYKNRHLLLAYSTAYIILYIKDPIKIKTSEDFSQSDW